MIYTHYLSTIFCQQQHMFAGRRHLTYPTLIGRARHARVRAYRAWDTYDGVLSVASKRQPSIQSSPFYIRQWGNPITVQRSLHGMGNMTPRIIWNLYAWKYIPIYNQHSFHSSYYCLQYALHMRSIIDILTPHNNRREHSITSLS